MADLQTIDNLEGALSSSHIQMSRRRVIESGGDLQDYQDTLAHELQLSDEAIAAEQAQRREDNGITYLDEDDDGSTAYAFDALNSAVLEG